MDFGSNNKIHAYWFIINTTCHTLFTNGQVFFRIKLILPNTCLVVLISCGMCSQCFRNVFLIMGLFASWPITRKNTHTMDTLKYNVTFPFGLGNGYKGIILAKWYGIMFGAIGNTWELEEHNVIVIGNYWEHRRNNTLGTWWKKSHTPPHPPKPQQRKMVPPWAISLDEGSSNS